LPCVAIQEFGMRNDFCDPIGDRNSSHNGHAKKRVDPAEEPRASAINRNCNFLKVRADELIPELSQPRT
jgi:hypothetical protein